MITVHLLAPATFGRLYSNTFPTLISHGDIGVSLGRLRARLSSTPCSTRCRWCVPSFSHPSLPACRISEQGAVLSRRSSAFCGTAVLEPRQIYRFRAQRRMITQNCRKVHRASCCPSATRCGRRCRARMLVTLQGQRQHSGLSLTHGPSAVCCVQGSGTSLRPTPGDRRPLRLS